MIHAHTLGPEDLRERPQTHQPALDAARPHLKSCHYLRGVQTMRLVDIDPTLALAFLCETEDVFADLCERCSSVFSASVTLFSILSAPPTVSMSSVLS